MARNDIKYSILEKDGEEFFGPTEHIPTAQDIAFDNTGTDFESEDLQAAVQEIGVALSPPLIFGGSGTNSSGSYYNTAVGNPSNQTGVLIFTDNTEITTVSFSNSNNGTFYIGVYQHDGQGVNLTLLGQTTITGSSGVNSVNFSVTTGKFLAVRLMAASDNTKDTEIQLFGKGTFNG